jgi:hypothetical protein
MELAASENGPGLRVTCKNHGFVVPTSSAGTNARVEGTVGTDEGQVKLVATGVELWP